MGQAHGYNSRFTCLRPPPLLRSALAPLWSQDQAWEGGPLVVMGKPRIVPMGSPHTWFPCAVGVW